MLPGEHGHLETRELWATAEQLVASRLLYPEARAALATASRAGRLDARQLRSSVGKVREVFDELRVIEVHPFIADGAGELAERHALKGFDAVHLASALATGPTTVMATFDSRLAAAASREGLAVAPSITQ